MKETLIMVAICEFTSSELFYDEVNWFGVLSGRLHVCANVCVCV